MSFLKLFLECIKEARQTKRDLKQIKNLDISLDSLQRLVDTVAIGSNEVEIELTLTSGNKMIIRRKPLDGTGYKSFIDRVKEAKIGRGK